MKQNGILSARPHENVYPNKIIMGKMGVVERMIFDGDVVKVVSARQKEYLSETVEWKPRDFVKTNVEELRLTLPELSIYEKAFIVSIQPYIGFHDCLLKYQAGNGERDMLIRDLVEITGCGKTKLLEVLALLHEKDIIYIGRNSKNNQYFVNPWLFNKGARINKVLAAMFQNYRIRSMGGTRWKDFNK